MFDPLEYHLLGKATMFLDGMSYVIEVEESVPIIDRGGTQVRCVSPPRCSSLSHASFAPRISLSLSPSAISPQIGELIMRLTPFKGETPPEPGEDNPMGEDRLEFLLGEELGILVFTHVVCV